MHFIKRFGGELVRLVAFAVIFGAVTSTATLYKWSQTASTNSTADASINWAEGMAPSAVNDSARAMMAAVAKFRDDTNGSLVTAGTSTAYTVATNQSFASLATMSGQTIRVRMSATNGASPTLNVDGLGAKNIVSGTGTAIASSVLIGNAVYDFSYNNSAGEWTVVGSTFAGVIPSGSKTPFFQANCPTGWTIDTTAALNDAAMVTVIGGGGGTTAGTTAFSSVMSNRTLSVSQLPTFTPSGTVSTPSISVNDNKFVAFSAGSGGTSVWGNGGNSIGISAASSAITFTGNPVGSGASIDFAAKYGIFIVCTKN